MYGLFFERKANVIFGLFNSRKATFLVMILIPIFFGLLSVSYGQASGWDFLNYHVYNGYALAHGRLDLDLAPGGFQSYFNPTLDYVYYLMSESLPPKFVGFLLGFVPALVFIPLWLSIKLVLLRSNLLAEKVYSLTTILALMGVFSVSFVARTGSVDGDSVTTIFQILALYIILSNVIGAKEKSLQVALWALVAGGVSGLGAGLKLTSAPASLALCVGLLFIGRQGVARLAVPFLFGSGVILGLAITGGYWFLQMYQHFGNPLFPQFGSLFSSNLASPVSVIDKRYLPAGFVDFFIWPFEFLFNPGRLSGDAWPQITWPLLYIAFIAFLIKKIKGGEGAPRRFDVSSTFVIGYTFFGFILWMLLFSIYRYQIYFSLTAPLVLWIFIRYIFGEGVSERYLVVISVFSILMALFFGVKSYEGEPWSDRYIQASPVNAFSVPVNSTVLLVGGQPIGWIAPFFPQSVSLVGIGNNFPVSDGYRVRVKELIAKNRMTYAVFEVPQNYRFSIVDRTNSVLGFFKINHVMWGCDSLRWLVDHTHLHASFRQFEGRSDGMQCGLTVSEVDDKKFAQETSEVRQSASSVLASYGYGLDGARCGIRHAYVGRRLFAFELCQLN